MAQITEASLSLKKMKLLGYNSLAEYGLCIPTNYHDYTRVREYVAHHVDRGRQLFKLHLIRDPDINKSRKPHVITLAVKDGHETLRLRIFGHEFRWRGFKAGDVVYIKGQAVRDNQGYLDIKSPELLDKCWVNKIVPRYRGRSGKDESDAEGKRRRALVSEDKVFAYVRKQVQEDPQATVDWITSILEDTEANILEATSLEYRCLADWLSELHFPETTFEAQRATEMAYRIAAHQLYLRSQRLNQKVKHEQAPIIMDIERADVVKHLKQLPFKPTGDQQRAMSDIIRDFNGAAPAYRLLSGDVGVGKTIVFLVPAVVAHEKGAKVAIMVPNIALCENLRYELQSIFPEIPVLHLKKGMRKNQVDLSCNPIVIGTQTLLFSKTGVLKDWTPDVLVVDEQQKLSKAQREQLKEAHTHYIEATATAIPKTLAMVSHGGMDYSSIQECPVEKHIETSLVVGRGSDYQGMLNNLKSVLNAGHQAALIYPLVEGDQDKDMTSVISRFEHYNAMFPGKVAMLHGKMKDEEKMQVIRDMKEGRYRLLISSSVVEVGVTLPDLKCLVVVSPDRYGTSQLHQFRGRVSRTGGEGFFFMFVPDIESEADLNPTTLQRLRLLEQYKHNDGFALAMADMDLRGFGDLESDTEKQNGASRTIFPSVKLMPIHLRAYEARKPLARVQTVEIRIDRMKVAEKNLEGFALEMG